MQMSISLSSCVFFCVDAMRSVEMLEHDVDVRDPYLTLHFLCIEIFDISKTKSQLRRLVAEMTLKWKNISLLHLRFS